MSAVRMTVRGARRARGRGPRHASCAWWGGDGAARGVGPPQATEPGSGAEPRQELEVDMRTRLVITLALAIASSTLAASAQGTDKAVDILAAARKAIGERKLDGLKTFSLQATVQRNVGSMQLISDTEMLLELPDKYVRFDVVTAPMNATTSSGFNGEKPVQRSNSSAGGGALVIRMGPGNLGNEKLTPDEQEKADRAAVRAMRQDLSRLMLGWFATTHPAVHAQYTYVGEAESPDGTAHVIEAKTNEGFVARVFIDAQTKLPLMVTYKAPQPRIVTAGGPGAGPMGSANAGADGHGKPATEEERKKARAEAEHRVEDLQKQPPVLVDYTLFFDDWRDADGIRFPYKIRRAMTGTTNEEWTVTKVKLNPTIDAKKFDG
jgi:hypothetical protein